MAVNSATDKFVYSVNGVVYSATCEIRREHLRLQLAGVLTFLLPPYLQGSYNTH